MEDSSRDLCMEMKEGTLSRGDWEEKRKLEERPLHRYS